MQLENYNLFSFQQVLSAVLAITLARPEPPRSRWGAPAQQQQYSSPPAAPQKQYGPPAAEPQQEYGPPKEEYGPPKEEYGPPAQQYGPPAQQYGPPPKVITKNVYVHVPPADADEIEYLPAKQIEVPVAKKHYKLIFIKAPAPPVPTAPVIPVQEQDEHKTLVYVLVKKPEPQPDIVIPTPEPTEPSKPEVFFIKYKQEKEKQTGPY